jgi:hypothetical protein
VARLKTISQFKSALSGGGARPNLFEVELTTFPSGISWDADKFKYLCKAAALPASNIGSIDVPFRGRTFKVAGDRTIDTWTVTIINDEDFRLRRAFENWTDLIAKLDNNLGATDPNAYMSNATVYQLGRSSGSAATGGNRTNQGSDSAILAAYKFVDIFPTNVSNIDLSYDSGDTIEEFTVEFQVQSYEIISGTTAAKV